MILTPAAKAMLELVRTRVAECTNSYGYFICIKLEEIASESNVDVAEIAVDLRAWIRTRLREAGGGTTLSCWRTYHRLPDFESDSAAVQARLDWIDWMLEQDDLPE